MRPSDAHYRCPDCGDPCYCEDGSPARALAHTRCGIRPGSRLGPVERRPRAAADLTLERRQRLAAAAAGEERPAPRATFTVDGPDGLERWRELVAAQTGARA